MAEKSDLVEAGARPFAANMTSYFFPFCAISSSPQHHTLVTSIPVLFAQSVLLPNTKLSSLRFRTLNLSSVFPDTFSSSKLKASHLFTAFELGAATPLLNPFPSLHPFLPSTTFFSSAQSSRGPLKLYPLSFLPCGRFLSCQSRLS